MQILQQKLIWFLGCGALLAILIRVNLKNKVISGPVMIKLKGGLSLIALGAAIGVLSRMDLLGRWLLESGVSFYLETILGYVIGGFLALWGIIELSKEHAEKRHNPKTQSRINLFAEKASAIVLKEHTTSSFLDEASKYLLLAVDCQAITVHWRGSNGVLNLAYQSGLSSQAEENLKKPQKDSLFHAAFSNKEIMSSDTYSELNSIIRIESKKGIIESGICIPLIHEADTLGVFTVLSVRKRKYRPDELELLEMICTALAPIMHNEKIENEYMREAEFRELMSLISKPFDHKASYTNALLDSAKAARGHLTFNELNLYISGNGPSRKNDYSTPDGGVINIIEGHFKKSEYPYLFGSPDDKGVLTAKDRQALIAPFDAGNQARGWLEIRLDYSPIYLAELLRAWSLLIAKKIGQEHLNAAVKQTSQWLGAIRYYQERALATDNVYGLMQEMAKLVVDIGMATFCRVTVTDPQKKHLKTAALAQVRPLKWSNNKDEIPTAEMETLHKALVNRKGMEFDQENPVRRISEREAALILPEGVRYGLIMPIAIGDEPVGLLILGEFRGRDRAVDPALAELFAANLSNLISMVLSWHKEKRVSQELIKEGKKKLTIITKEPTGAPSDLNPKLRSRINGPLAGIIASCEYLQNNYLGLEDDMIRYLGIIERNAAKIHEITVG